MSDLGDQGLCRSYVPRYPHPRRPLRAPGTKLKSSLSTESIGRRQVAHLLGEVSLDRIDVGQGLRRREAQYGLEGRN
jgi:hypothetical protein